ncbi:MAG: hypothetical protein JST80_02715 [Bdellovibrionales bacterium]|nr:hypothetical protein [Bdellovibrionales bacterium]
MNSFKVGMLALYAFTAFACVLVNPVVASAHVHKQATKTDKVEKLCDFAPQNDVNIPAGLEMHGDGIDETTFNAVIDKVSSFYSPIIASKGGKLNVNRKWTDGTVNASATRQGKTWTVNMYGGLARFQGMTSDGFAMVMCHELGHHLGGFPRVKGIFGINSWASNEGQADYFATMKCFRRVFENEDNVDALSNVSVPEAVTEACSKTFKSQKEIALCQRAGMTSKVLADTLYALGRRGSPSREPATAPSFTTPSTAEVSTTDNDHPLAQCRLDTYMAGAICGMPYTEDFAQDNATGGACAEERGDKYAFRPHCWYKVGKRKP